MTEDAVHHGEMGKRAPVQPAPTISVEKMPDKKWLKLTHARFSKYLTMEEAHETHLYMAETCGSNCDCWRRGFEAGLNK